MEREVELGVTAWFFLPLSTHSKMFNETIDLCGSKSHGETVKSLSLAWPVGHAKKQKQQQKTTPKKKKKKPQTNKTRGGWHEI